MENDLGAIATWRMAHDGLLKATEELQQGGAAGTAVEQLIKEVEDYPFISQWATAVYLMRKGF